MFDIKYRDIFNIIIRNMTLGELLNISLVNKFSAEHTKILIRNHYDNMDNPYYADIFIDACKSNDVLFIKYSFAYYNEYINKLKYYHDMIFDGLYFACKYGHIDICKILYDNNLHLKDMINEQFLLYDIIIDENISPQIIEWLRKILENNTKNIN